MESPSKSGGAASPVCEGKEGANAESKYSPENINLPEFCNHVRIVIPANGSGERPFVFNEFKDSIGLTWFCFRPLSCEHAIVREGKLVSCRVRTASLKGTKTAGQELRFV